MSAKITVHEVNGAYFLRLWMHDRSAGLLCMETARIFSKSEADYRAIIFSGRHGFDRDDLPTHPANEAAPTFSSP